MAQSTVTTIGGETVDLICRAAYGDESGYVEAVLDINPGLAALGPILPANIVVALPEMGAAPVVAVDIVTLW